MELGGDNAGRAVRSDPVHLNVLEWSVHAVAQPFAGPGRVPCDLETRQMQVAGGAGTGVLLDGRVPLDEERKLRVGLQTFDTDLVPLELETVGAVPVAEHGLTTQAHFDVGDVVDVLDHPASDKA